MLSTPIFLLLFFICVPAMGVQEDPSKPQLLYEPNAPDYRFSEAQSLFDKLAVDASLSTFMDALTQVDSVLQLVNNTDIQQPFTLFCPVNSAFRGLDGDWRSHLDAILKKHVVPSVELDVEHLQRNQELQTMLESQTIQVHHHFFSRKTELDGIAAVDTDHPIQAANGIAYRVTKVLRPE